MIKPEQIYAATEDGLRILEIHIPNVREFLRSKKAFKLREESTASAYVKHQKRHDGLTVYGVTDFGDDGKMKDPIQIHMDATGLRFPEAIMDLAQMFGVQDCLNRAINKPDIRQDQAPADMPDGHEFFELLDDFTDDMCRVMGPKVTREHLRALHWLPVKFFARVKDRRITFRYSNERFPIFMRECWYTNKEGKQDCFYKLYEPMNPDKNYRFSYTPRGKKQPDYVNGLSELRDTFRRMNDEEEAAWLRDPANEGKPYIEKKLPSAVICSGERDSLCARSQGYLPLWLNSETVELTAEAHREIMRYVEVLYNIPDVDATGISRGSKMALKYMDIHTVWLPSEYLSQYRDNRGKPRKDLRDWMELRPEPGEFKKLINRAVPACFWTVKIETSKDGKNVKRKFYIDFICLKNFLNLNGFFTLRDKTKKDTQFIKVTGNIVELVTPKEIRAFVEKWAEEESLDRELRNLIANTQFLNAASLESLRELDPDFTNYTDRAQWFYFPKFALEVTAAGIIKHDSRSNITGRYVWRQNVIDHDVKVLDDMFTITHPEGQTDSADFDITINAHGSNYFRYLINSSRIYWRKELEQNLAGLTEGEARQYRAAHRFDIEGEGLTPEEIQEQKQCLINKIFTIGYMMHRFKSPSRPWAPFVMDNVIGENDQCNGGSGKSFMFKALSQFVNFVPLPGRNTKLFENQFWAERISRHVDIALFDDIDEYFPIKQLYDTITGDMTINPKNNQSYTLTYEEAPKFAFTTNYVPKEFNGSTVRRMLYVVMSDYYHQLTEENDYNETRTIRDDFNKDLFSSQYTEDEWAADINFIMQCVRFYLSVAPLNIKIEPKMSNIIYRKYLRDMSDNFRDWAEQYFAEGGDHLDCAIVRQEAYEDYKRFSGAGKTTMQGFTKALKGYCYTYDYIDELNPEDQCNSGGGTRILKRISDPLTGKTKSTDMIYLRTATEARKMEQPEPVKPEQGDLFKEAPDKAPF